MGLPRSQLQIRSLMAAVAVLAVLLSSLTWARWVQWLSLVLVMFVGVFGLFVVLPTALAPRSHRVEVAYWAMALHPLMFLAWLGIWRFLLDPRPLRPTYGGWYLMLTLEVPYFFAWLSSYYLWAFVPVAAFVGTGRDPARIAVRPLLVLMAAGLMTRIILICDPLRMSD